MDAKSIVGKTQPPGTRVPHSLARIVARHISVTMTRPVQDKPPSYPSSSQRAKDWNKLEAEIKKNEKENKDEMGDANA